MKQELKNLLLIVFFCPVSWSHVLFVFFLHIDAFLYQELNDVVSFILDGVPDRPLQLVVHIVMLGPTTYHELCSLHVTFANTVEYCSLSVLVTAIDVATVINEQIDNLIIAFSSRIEQWDLL